MNRQRHKLPVSSDIPSRERRCAPGFLCFVHKLSFMIESAEGANPSPGEKVDSKTAGTDDFEDGSGMREIA